MPHQLKWRGNVDIVLIVLFIRKRNRSSCLTQHDQSNRLAADSSTGVKSSDTGAEQPTRLYSYYFTLPCFIIGEISAKNDFAWEDPRQSVD